MSVTKKSIKAHGWVFPPSPVTNGIMVGMTDELAKEIISIIRDCCLDEYGKPLIEGNNPELITFASRLEQNLLIKASFRNQDTDYSRGA